MTNTESIEASMYHLWPILIALAVIVTTLVGYFFSRLYHARMVLINRMNKGLVSLLAYRALLACSVLMNHSLLHQVIAFSSGIYCTSKKD